MGATATGGAAADGPPVRGGNLTVAVPTDPQSLDMVANPGQVTAQIGNMMYEKLFEVDQGFVARPMLVDTFTTSPDRLTYTFKLRQGVTFQDGNPLTGNDVVVSLQRWQKSHRTGQLVTPDIDTITAPDAATVSIHLKRPRYPLVDELAGAGTEIYEAKNLTGLPATGFEQDKAIGTGPYKLKSWDIGQQLVLERYDGYKSRTEENWGGQAGAKHAYLDTITYKIVGDQDALISGLQTGQWDHAMPTNDQYETLKANPNLVVHNLPGGNENVIIPNFNPGSKFADPRARQALNLLLDKPAINAATGGSKDLTIETGAFASPDNKASYSAMRRRRLPAARPGEGAATARRSRRPRRVDRPHRHHELLPRVRQVGRAHPGRAVEDRAHRQDRHLRLRHHARHADQGPGRLGHHDVVLRLVAVLARADRRRSPWARSTGRRRRRWTGCWPSSTRPRRRSRPRP